MMCAMAVFFLQIYVTCNNSNAIKSRALENLTKKETSATSFAYIIYMSVKKVIITWQGSIWSNLESEEILSMCKAFFFFLIQGITTDYDTIVDNNW